MAPAAPPFPALAEPELFERLQAWSLDPPKAKTTFAHKLAHENGWSVPQAARVVAEYRRFLYLAVAAGHPVCPSDAVDQAWHLHLLDTRSYWQNFCPEVLGRPLHHTPSRGGTEEQEQMRQWYRRTLASYQATFGEAPPADLWPPTERRFCGAEQWRRVDAGRCWLLPRSALPGLPRRRWGATPRLGPWVLLAALALGLSGCGAKALPFPYTLTGPEFLLFYGLVTGLSLLIVVTLQDAVAPAKGRLCGGLVIGAVWVLGLTRLIQGVADGRPVLLLIIALGLVSAALFTSVFTDQWIGAGRKAPRNSAFSRKDRRARGTGSDSGGGGGCGGGGVGCSAGGGGGCGGGGCGGCGGGGCGGG